MQEIQVQSLGREDPLEKKMATHSSVLAWRIPWTEEPGGLPSTGSQRVSQDRAPEPGRTLTSLDCLSETLPCAVLGPEMRFICRCFLLPKGLSFSRAKLLRN